MEECACLCSVGSSRGCRCPQKRQRPVEMAAAEGKRCPQKRQRPVEMAAADGKRAPAKKHIEGDVAAWCCAGSGGIASPMPAPHCSLQDLPVEMLVEIFAWLDNEYYRTLVNVVVDGFCITGWKYRPSLHTHVGGPIHFKPSFRIRLTERKSATVECMEGLDSRPHNRHMQIQKDRFTTRCKNTDHGTDLPTWLREEGGPVLEDRQQYDWLTYRRLYLPPRHPDDLIRPGLFQYYYDAFGLKIAMLSFHGKYARVTKITGVSKKTLEIHLMRRIQLRDGEIFHNFNELSRVVQEIDEQVIREQQQ
ncbi:F-box only protein 31-like, partial [Myotis lucifugus]|uniref:F-box only protein 31-like n=1 Tax=Myotis lucifugus TaxID=59463 RepID=UPI000CCC23B5